MLESIFPFEIKRFSISAVLALAIAPIEPFLQLFLVIVGIIVWDIIVGSYASLVVKKEKFQSSKIRRKVIQILLIYIACSNLRFGDLFFSNLGVGEYAIGKYVLSVYGIYELISLFEKFIVISPKFNLFLTILKKKLFSSFKEVQEVKEEIDKQKKEDDTPRK